MLWGEKITMRLQTSQNKDKNRSHFPRNRCATLSSWVVEVKIWLKMEIEPNLGSAIAEKEMKRETRKWIGFLSYRNFKRLITKSSLPWD